MPSEQALQTVQGHAGVEATSSEESTVTTTVTDLHGQTGVDTVTFSVDDVPRVTDVTITPDPAWADDALACSWTLVDGTADASTTSGRSTARWSAAARPSVRATFTVTPSRAPSRRMMGHSWVSQ